MTYAPVLLEKFISAKSLTLRIAACFLVQQYFGKKAVNEDLLHKFSRNLVSEYHKLCLNGAVGSE